MSSLKNTLHEFEEETSSTWTVTNKKLEYFPTTNWHAKKEENPTKVVSYDAISKSRPIESADGKRAPDTAENAEKKAAEVTQPRVKLQAKPLRTDPPHIIDIEDDGNRGGFLKIWIPVVVVCIGFFFVLSKFGNLSSTSAGAAAQADAALLQAGIQKLMTDSAERKKDDPPDAREDTSSRGSLASPSNEEFDSSLQVKVKNRSRLHAKGANVLIVDGMIVNDSRFSKSGVVVKGKIMGNDGHVLSEVTAPCGRFNRYSRIKETRPENIADLYEKGGKPFNCVIRSGQGRKYQLVFPNVPKEVGNNFKVEAHAIASAGRKRSY